MASFLIEHLKKTRIKKIVFGNNILKIQIDVILK